MIITMPTAAMTIDVMIEDRLILPSSSKTIFILPFRVMPVLAIMP